MPLIIVQPTSTQNPDNSLGGNAVTSISNTGHGSTTTSSVAISNGSDADEKSARWLSFPTVLGPKRSVTLKLSWDVSGDANASDDGSTGNGSADANFIIEYSTNGGSSWSTITSSIASAFSPGSPNDSFTNTSSTGTSLPLTQDISQVQVRVDYLTDASAGGGPGNSGSGSITATSISGIQIEVVTWDSPLMQMA